MDRRKELLKFIENDENLIPLVDRLLFLETKLAELEKMPFIRVNPANPERQKATPAAKQYKELLQQYVNVFKALQKVTGGEDKEETPLRKWVKSRNVEIN
jgi:hypothetical protein